MDIVRVKIGGRQFVLSLVDISLYEGHLTAVSIKVQTLIMPCVNKNVHSIQQK